VSALPQSGGHEKKDSRMATTSIPAQPAGADSETGLVVLPPLSDRGGNTVILWEVVRIAFESLVANRTRSILTMLGMIIGVASVVALLSLGQGATASITSQVEALGTNLVYIVPGTPGGGTSNASIASLTREDVDAIAALNLPLNALAPEFSGIAPVIAAAADKQATVVGVTPAFVQTNNLKLDTGIFLDDGHVRSASPVVVLGSTLATDLFGRGSAIGQNVRISGRALRVVGVLSPKGGSSFGSVDDRAFVPITLAQQQLFNGRTPDGNSYRVSTITLSAINSADLPNIQARVMLLLRDRHNLKADGSADDFIILDQKTFLSTLTTITTMLTLFVGAVAGISLLVGGIGIMNIMLVSVTERTREIGLRKAVGAQPRDILLQFIVEAVTISVVGGLIGLALGGALVTGVTLSGLFTAPVTPVAVVVSIGFSMAVGLFFGIYPAQRAAQLNPIEALRHE
jgi:putative ABC transport system permease protein